MEDNDFLSAVGKAVMMTAAGKALKGAARGAGMLTGCSGSNTLPTDGNDDEIRPAGETVCYNLNGSKYRVELAEPQMSSMRSVRGKDNNGRIIVMQTDWITDDEPNCNDEFKAYSPKREMEDEDEDD